MPVHETRLARRETVAEGTMAFHFERPQGFSHEAGQNAIFTLIDPPETDAQGPARPFTIASAPHEPDLMIATRMRDSAFKRALRNAPLGLKMRVDGPGGVMVLHEDTARPAAFLAGGIGITPFLSMARHAAKQRLPHRIFLFYSNRRPEDAAFLDELQALEKTNPNYRFIATMAEAEKSARPWSGERGFIRRDMLERHLPDLLAPVYYLAGPPAMAMAMQAMLAGFGVAEADMRSEEFYGY
ncbi:MAG: FAD-dependent oxidoreductase [Betaproteobacteria bacterium]